jgi:hypothetical protein
VRVLKSEYTDPGHAGRGSGEVYSFQCAGGPGPEARYVLVRRDHIFWSNGKHWGLRDSAECAMEGYMLMRYAGIKEYSEWPTIPQLYVDKEFVGGCDILMTMHQDGSLAKMLEEKGVVVPAEAEQKP